MNTTIFTGSLLLGLAGTLHCAGMCGPLMMAVPFGSGGAGKATPVVYFLGKTVSYAVMGFFAGLMGRAFFVMQWQQLLSVLAGVLMLLFTFLPLLRAKAGKGLFHRRLSKLYSTHLNRPRWYSFLVLGMLNGLLPCGLVYTALALAVAAGSSWQGAAVMALFGVASTPALLLMVFARRKVPAGFRMRLLSFSKVITCAVAVLLILRGMNLGIPYISPHADHGTVKSCCAR